MNRKMEFLHLKKDKTQKSSQMKYILYTMYVLLESEHIDYKNQFVNPDLCP